MSLLRQDQSYPKKAFGTRGQVVGVIDFLLQYLLLKCALLVIIEQGGKKPG